MTRPRGRPRQDEGLEDIPGTMPGMGLRVSRARIRKTRLMGVMGLGNGLPRPVDEGIAQRTLVEVPESCGRCGSLAITFNRDIETPGPARRVSCFICGWDAYLVLPLLAPVLGPIEIESRALGTRATISLDAPPVRAARPRRSTDRRKRPTNMPEPPPRYDYPPERSRDFRPNGGVELGLPSRSRKSLSD